MEFIIVEKTDCILELRNEDRMKKKMNSRSKELTEKVGEWINGGRIRYVFSCHWDGLVGSVYLLK